MKYSMLPLSAICLVLLGCSSVSNSRPQNVIITPTQAILLAANAAPAEVPGIFEMVVRRVGRQDGNIYLDSEVDYRDQRNLVIAILPSAAEQLRTKFGQDADRALDGQHIRISGQAKRVKIVFIADGVPSDSYYYQTHVDVSDAGQIEVLR
jgi:hypothetical protein